MANHIAAGLMGIIGGIFHITNRPGERLYRALKLGSLEGVLASALAAVLFVSFVVSGTMWYGSATTPVELFGPCLLYTSPSPRDRQKSRMPSSA